MPNFTQEDALRDWRKASAKNDPPFYSVKILHSYPHIWLNFCGNVGWYRPVVKAGKLVAFHDEGSLPYQLWNPEEPKDRCLNWRLKLLSPKQQAKLVHYLNSAT